ncbi:MAG: winged helix-turn-helix domain-containing protein [Candidatus Thorarchaeota archaeon]
MTSKDLQEVFNIYDSTVSCHLKKLEDFGLIKRKRHARIKIIQIKFNKKLKVF